MTSQLRHHCQNVGLLQNLVHQKKKSLEVSDLKKRRINDIK